MSEIPTSSEASSYFASSYVKKTLQKGESQPVFFPLSQWQYFGEFVSLSITFGVLFAVIMTPVSIIVSIANGSNGHLWFVVISSLVLFFLFQSLYMIYIHFRRAATEYAVSNKRVVMKVGILSRHTDEVRPDAIEAVTVTQGILGRMFNFGSCVIRGRGIGSLRMSYVIDPLKVKTTIEQHTSP